MLDRFLRRCSKSLYACGASKCLGSFLKKFLIANNNFGFSKQDVIFLLYWDSSVDIFRKIRNVVFISLKIDFLLIFKKILYF